MDSGGVWGNVQKKNGRGVGGVMYSRKTAGQM